MHPPAEEVVAPEPDPRVALKKGVDFIGRELESRSVNLGERFDWIHRELNSKILVRKQSLDDQPDGLARHGS